MDKGKKLEADCQKYCKQKGIWLLRLYDSRSAGTYLPAQPSDYIMIKKSGTEFLECKETNNLRLSISDFQPAQLKAMQRAYKEGIKYTIIVLIRKKHYCSLDSSEILEAINLGNKSIPLNSESFSYKIKDVFIK